MSRAFRWGLAAVIALAIAGSLSFSAAAQTTELGGKVRSGDTVVIAAGETVAGDLYVFGGTVQVNGTVDGDLVAFAGNVEIAGSVSGDVIAGAGTILVTGVIDGDARLSGGEITIAGDIGEDLVHFGGTLNLASGGTVGGDTLFAGGQASLSGKVGGSILGSSGAYARTGTVGGSEEVATGEDDAPAARDATRDVADAVRQFVLVVLTAALALWLAPRQLRAVADTVRTRTLASLGSGLLVLGLCIAAFIAIVLGAMAIGFVAALLDLGALIAIDVILALLLTVALVLALFVGGGFLATVVVSYALALRFASAPANDRWRELLLLALGAAALAVLAVIPGLGPLVKIAIVLLGLGAMFIAARGSRGQPPPAAYAVATP